MPVTLRLNPVIMSDAPRRSLVRVRLPLNAPQVVVELVRHLGHLLEVVSRKQNLLRAPVPVRGQSHSTLERIPNLPPVPDWAAPRSRPLLRLEKHLGILEDVGMVKLDQTAVGQFG